MAILGKIRDTFRNTAVGALMIGTIAIPNAANAAEGNVAYKDIRNDTPGYIELAGPIASGKNRIALKVNGGDENFLNNVWDAAIIIAEKTERDVWFLLSEDPTPNDGKIEIEIYISGGKTGTLTLNQEDDYLLNEKLVAVVSDGINRSDVSTASLEVAALTADNP